MPRVVLLLHILSLLGIGFCDLGKWMRISEFLDIYIGEIARITFHSGRMGEYCTNYNHKWDNYLTMLKLFHKECSIQLHDNKYPKERSTYIAEKSIQCSEPLYSTHRV